MQTILRRWSVRVAVGALDFGMRRAWAWRFAPLPTLVLAQSLSTSSISCRLSAQHLRQDRLGAPASAMDVGAIEEADAQIERLVNDRARRREIERTAEIVAAEPDRGHKQARLADLALLHDIAPLHHVTVFEANPTRSPSATA
jgi:hypothetical protein